MTADCSTSAASSPKRRILHVIPGFGGNGTLGGAERAVATILTGLQSRDGYKPELCVIRRPDPQDERHGLTCPIHFLNYHGPEADLRMAAACAADLRRLIRQVRPDIVHSHLWPAAFTTGVAIRGLHVSHVIHIHDQRLWLGSRSIRHRLRRWAHRLLMRMNATMGVACSQATAAFTRDHFRPRTLPIHVIPYGIDCRRYSDIPLRASIGDPSAPVTMGVAARLTLEKGIRQLLEACAVLSRRSVNYRLLIAGGGGHRTDFEALTRDLQLQGCVHFSGFVVDMPGFYESIDAFVLPSLSTEGLPLSILEAMAAGRPVVVTAVSGIPEAVTNGSEGFVVPAGDVSALANAIGRLVANPELRDEMGRRARARAQREFSAERMIKDVTTVYDEILSRRNGLQ